MSYQISVSTRHRLITAADTALPASSKGFDARSATTVLLYLTATGGAATLKVAWWCPTQEKYFYDLSVPEIELPAAGDYVVEVKPLGSVGFVYVGELSGSELDVRVAITRGV